MRTILTALILFLAPVVAVGQTLPVEKRLDGADTQPRLTREERLERLFQHLLGEYEKVLKSKDWANRAMACVSVAQVPGPKATEKLFDVLAKDTAGATRITAWHCLLARSKYFSAEEHQRLLSTTLTLAEKDGFAGASRAQVIRYLTLHGPAKRHKEVWRQYFSQTNLGGAGREQSRYMLGMDGRDPSASDLETIHALADCLKTWRSPDLLEFLIERMGTLDDAYRAEYILRIACDLQTKEQGEKPKVPLALEFAPQGSKHAWETARGQYVAWLRQNKTEWVERAGAAADLNTLINSPHVPTPDLDVEKISTLDPKWRRDLELRMPEIRSLNISFVVDATGSMQEGIYWVRTQIPPLMNAVALLCREPKMGVTFYRDHGDEFVTRISPMVGREQVDTLVKFVGQQWAKGGLDDPEAVLEGLTATIEKNPWPTPVSARKIIVLVGDAPPHPKTQPQVEKLVADLSAKGFRFYTVSLAKMSDAPFKSIAESSGGFWLPVQMSYVLSRSRYDIVACDKKGFHPSPYISEWLVPGVETEQKKPRGKEWVAGRKVADETPEQEAYTDTAGMKLLLQQILVDAVNPQFKERIGPVMAITLEALDASNQREKRIEFPSYTPKPINYGDAGGGIIIGGPSRPEPVNAIDPRQRR